ncbi:MAG: hypothetical protein PWP45_1274 [Tepidanaerobacteraceae bacterium]|nr:hypothetical protein [Tepidanaerobacteraceae bacterium]
MAYQIKVTISRITPPIWRRLRIPGNITFYQLHRILQVAFGWLDYHLYEFDFGDVVIVEPDPEFEMAGLSKERVELDPREALVDQFFDKYDRCIYTYDFGDRWEHEIKIEKKLKDTKKNSVPKCIDGAGHRPPEDVGGIGGYERFLAIIKDKKHPEREEYLAWAEKDTKGRMFDSEYFYLPEINRKLLHVLEDDVDSALRLFKGRRGLSGTLKFGWYEPCVETENGTYSWERIGDLLTWLCDSGYTITIKVSKVRKNDI